LSQTTERQPRRRERATLWIGCAVTAVGLAMLGYVGWQLIGTNIVSHHKQQQLVEELHQNWSDHTAAGEASGNSGEATSLVRIPRFGEDYVIPVLEGVGDDELASGFGHFEASADPGEIGNFALAGHRITHGEPLRDMPDLRPGDEVLVETREAIFTYRLDTDPSDLEVDFHQTWVLDPRPVNPDASGVQPSDDSQLLTLTTCAELFHDDDRMIAFGHLVAMQRK
jgi:sortase A